MERLKPLQEYDGILFTCASSAGRFLDAAGEQWGKWNDIYSIGPKTTAQLKKYGIEKIIEAKQCTYEGIAEVVMSNNRKETVALFP